MAKAKGGCSDKRSSMGHYNNIPVTIVILSIGVIADNFLRPKQGETLNCDILMYLPDKVHFCLSGIWIYVLHLIHLVAVAICKIFLNNCSSYLLSDGNNCEEQIYFPIFCKI